ncbi:MAG TPA: pyridoxal 5'-phosphate synthase, partial [Gammaproteobacteria bacterium]
MEDAMAQDDNGQGLSRDDLHENPIQQFEYWLAQAEVTGIADANAMTLATVAKDNRPSQRIVLLKDFDEAGFVFYTNLESRKAQEIDGNPQVSLHFAWLGLHRQVCISGHAEKLPATEAFRYFVTRPQNSQLSAWASQQSRPISSRQLLEQQF